jgi:hypothetical protein
VRPISRTIKIGLVFAVIITSGVALWLIPPLFYPLPMMDEDLDIGEPTILASGFLNTFDQSHYGQGEVQLVQLARGWIACDSFCERNHRKWTRLVCVSLQSHQFCWHWQ